MSAKTPTDRARAVFEQIVDHLFGRTLSAFESLELFDEVDADLLTNLLEEVDATFFVGGDPTGARWDQHLAGSGRELWERLLEVWDGTTLEGVEPDGRWLSSEDRFMRGRG